MNQNTRQRIVGTLVLLLVAIVLLPVIFDGESSYQPDIEPVIPPPPATLNMPDVSPQRPDISPQAPAVTPAQTIPEQEDSSAQQSPSVPAETAGAAPQLDSQGLPQGWSVRMGSFGNEANAQNLLARLQESGYRAYSRKITASQGELTVVLVGPRVDRAATLELQERLRTEFPDLNSTIVRYEIESL